MKLYNTATRTKEEFKPLIAGKVGIYSCGPTVYSSPHIGNMYAYVCWDVLVRAFKYLGYQVNQVMNVTDVGELNSSGEDKMEKGARTEGMLVWDVAKKYEKEFFESSLFLNINRPDVVCRATEYINEQIELIKKIEANGFTYRIDDGLYFDTSKFAGYADFANLKLEELVDTDRDEISKQKRNRSDFALWKFSPKDRKREMEWDSPWGRGFPGWHIECTAMSTKHLGEVFDIHTGGIDHIPVHHTNEVAQGFGAFGHQTANYWLHNGFLTLKGEKVSKSTGGLYTVGQLVEMGYDPLAYRLMVISSHYRSGVGFSIELVDKYRETLNRWRGVVAGWADGGKIDNEYKGRFEENLKNDLAMPEIMALIWKLVKDENIKGEDKKATILDFDRVLGLKLDERRVEDKVPEDIRKLLEERKIARESKDWVESDRLREEMKSRGWEVEDTASDYKLKKSL